jgi:hypothetical protein
VPPARHELGKADPNRCHANGICISPFACWVQNAYPICMPVSSTETSKKDWRSTCLSRTHDVKGLHAFQSTVGKMDGLRGLCNLLGGRASMHAGFACPVRDICHVLQCHPNAFCICMPEYLIDWAQPNGTDVFGWSLMGPQIQCKPSRISMYAVNGLRFWGNEQPAGGGLTALGEVHWLSRYYFRSIWCRGRWDMCA